MLTKARVFLALILAGSLAALIYIGFFYKCVNRSGLLLAVPKSASERGVPVETIEELNEEKLMLTYEQVQSKSVTAINKTHSALVKATNYTYPYVFGYPLAAGGFFTKDNQERKTKTAVLNEYAAFQMFGGSGAVGSEITIDGAKHEIVGVIRDVAEAELNVYIPITLTDNRPNAFMARTDEGIIVSKEYILSELKASGISDRSYDFIDINMISERMRMTAVFAVSLIFCSLLVYVLVNVIGSFVGSAVRLRDRARHYYFFGLLAKEFFLIIKLLLTGGLIVAMCGGLLWIFTEYINGFLRLDIGSNLFISYAGGSFTDVMTPLTDMNMYSNIAFIVFALGLAMFIMLTKSYERR